MDKYDRGKGKIVHEIEKTHKSKMNSDKMFSALEIKLKKRKKKYA